MFLFDNASQVESMMCTVDVKKTPVIQKTPVKVVGQSVRSPVCGCAVAEFLSYMHGLRQCVFGDLCRHMPSSDSCFFIVFFDVAQAQALEIAPVLRGVRAALLWRQEQPIRLKLLN